MCNKNRNFSSATINGLFSALTGNKQDCYVELSRLPSELLRPAALEQFLRPSTPLTLSSVKVVFDPKGKHFVSQDWHSSEKFQLLAFEEK